MQISSRFTIAVHIVAAIDCFSGVEKVTSGFLAGSVGVHPVIIRTLIGKLKEAGIVEISQGKRGVTLAKKLDEITFYDVWNSVDCVHDDGLFHFHDAPNPACPVGRNIHRALDEQLLSVQRAMEERMKQITLADVVGVIQDAAHEESA